MRRINSTQRNYIIIGLCTILVIMAVGYAAFQSQLKITGTSNIGSNFLVKITDIQSSVVSGGASDAAAPSYTNTTATFHTNLVSPGDSMKYDITVSNEGSIDAILESIDVNTNNNPAITFETSGIEEGSELKVQETDILTVIVSYNSSVTSQPENTSSTISVTLNYKQNDGTVLPTPSGTTPNDLKALAITEGDGLYADEYEAGRYFYKGTNPNNYLTFNNEIWRILSVEADGSLKIVRDELLSERAWDSSGINGSNQWDRPADIKTYLNGEYLEGITVNKDKIEDSTWSIGAVTYDNNDLAGQIADENGTQSQEASVGLITVSEYLRANTNTEECGNLSLNNDNRDTCKTTNWLYKGSFYWTLSPQVDDLVSVFSVTSAGNVNNPPALLSYGIWPVLYLSSDISLSGTGTQEQPYTIV